MTPEQLRAEPILQRSHALTDGGRRDAQLGGGPGEIADAYSAQLKKRNKGQTLRLYNPATQQWSIYLVDVDKGTLDLPPVIGQFTGNRGEFYNQDSDKGRALYVRYVWPISRRRPLAWSSLGLPTGEKPGR
jgi:hypothetical protein